MARRETVVLGFLGTTLDAGKGPARWQRWRPSVALCQHDDLSIDRFELLHHPHAQSLARTVTEDIGRVSPETVVRSHHLAVQDAWDFEQVYGALHDFARSYRFEPERADYLVHITTGTHVAQICLFLLTEAHYLPARLIQTSPSKQGTPAAGRYTLIDLDLSRYDQLAARFARERSEGLSLLKVGIATRNEAFNALIERIERVALGSRAPVLLIGPTGAGKSRLARRIYELKKARRQVAGAFAEVNCATLRGDAAMSALFGHVKGAFTGAVAERHGLLRKADGGVLFLDEIGDLGLDEQAMLLRAIEEKVFLPVGSDREARSEFQLLAGTHRDLGACVAAGTFREDLLARIDLWTFRLPALRERPEDIAPNLDYELDAVAQSIGTHVTMSREARDRFLAFAVSTEAHWPGNFRDLDAAVTRMATLADGGRITAEDVEDEIVRLRSNWRAPQADDGAARDDDPVQKVLGARRAAALDRFDRVQLADVLRVCAGARSISDAGRVLFAQSRTRRSVVNDADRLRKYLARFELGWDDVGPAP